MRYASCSATSASERGWGLIAARFLIALLLMAAIAAQRSQACNTIRPNDYLIFSGQDIRYSRSDFQGPSGALGNIELSSFLVNASGFATCSGLVAGQNISFRDGMIQGAGAAAGADFFMQRASVQGTVEYGGRLRRESAHAYQERASLSLDVRNLRAAWQFFLDQSASLSRKQANARARLAPQTLVFSSPLDEAVFDIPSWELARASVLRLSGSSSARFIINVRGPSASITEKAVTLAGGLRPGQIIFNFPEATSLKISASGNAKFGIPATILAPYADVDFTNGLVTGGVYVGNLRGNGQVNAAATDWPPL